jgi:hypothetical protein
MRRRFGLWRALGLAVLVAGAPGTGLPVAGAADRTAEVYLIVTTDLQRLHPSGPPDEPVEPEPALASRARDVVTAQFAARHRGVNLLVFTNEAPPNPRVPGDLLKLVDRGVDDVIVVTLGYHVRLDSFRATGAAGVRGQVAIHSVVAGRQVASRSFVAAARYPGDVTREAVVKAELGARAGGAPIPVEQVELGLLDQAVKRGFARELLSALGVYHPPSLPRTTSRAVQESLERLARFLAEAPDRRAEAIQVLGECLRRFPGSSRRAELAGLMRQAREAGAPGPEREAERRQERASNRVRETLTAAQLADLFEKLVGWVVEVREFKLWPEGNVLWMTPSATNQRFIVEQAPARVRDAPADPPAMYVEVVERRRDESIPVIDLVLPVLRWVGCPRASCPGGG